MNNEKVRGTAAAAAARLFQINDARGRSPVIPFFSLSCIFTVARSCFFRARGPADKQLRVRREPVRAVDYYCYYFERGCTDGEPLRGALKMEIEERSREGGHERDGGF